MTYFFIYDKSMGKEMLERKVLSHDVTGVNTALEPATMLIASFQIPIHYNNESFTKIHPYKSGMTVG